MLSMLAAASLVLPALAARPTDVRLQVVDGKNAPVVGADVVHATVRAIGEGSPGRMRDGVELDEWLARAGVGATTDARGELVIPSEEATLVQVRAGDEFAMVAIDASAAVPVRVALEPDVSLRVQVVDSSGEPAVGVPVELVPLFDDGTSLRETGFPWTTTTRGREGIASFVHLQTRVPGVRASKCRARVDLAFEPAIAADVDFRAVGRKPLGLALPPTGSVIVTSTAPNAIVRLHHEKARRIGAFHPGTDVAFVDGEALFPFVGLGLELEARVEEVGVFEPARTPFTGPRVAGEIVRVAATPADATSVLVGRVLDEDGVTVSEEALSIDLGLACGNSFSSRGAEVHTDREGRFRLEVSRTVASGCTRTILVRRSWRTRSGDVPYSHETEPALSIALPEVITTAPHDLGDVRIVSPASKRRFEPLSDQVLAGAVREARESGPGNVPRLIDSLLCEIVRRGGKTWEQFLESELRRERPERVAEFTWQQNRRDLELLTALRRLQGKRDPLAIVVAPESTLDVAVPDTAVLVLDLKNVDEGGAAFDVQDGGDYRSGRLARFVVEVRRADGVVLSPVAWDSSFGGGFQSTRRLAPGESIRIAIPVVDHVFVRTPGRYEARVRYHDHDTIADEPELGGLIVFDSPWTRFDVRENLVTMTAAERKELRELVDGVPGAGVAWKLSRPWRPGWVFAPDDPTPDEQLWSYGRKGLLSLFEALDDPKITPRKRAWVLVQLYNLTGCNDPSSRNGSFETIKDMSVQDRHGVVRFIPTENYRGGRIDEHVQRALVESWGPVRASIRFEIRD